MFPQQQAPAALSLQHVPVVLLKGPVFVVGQSHMPSRRLTAIVLTPCTVTLMMEMRPCAKARPCVAEAGSVVW